MQKCLQQQGKKEIKGGGGAGIAEQLHPGVYAGDPLGGVGVAASAGAGPPCFTSFSSLKMNLCLQLMETWCLPPHCPKAYGKAPSLYHFHVLKKGEIIIWQTGEDGSLTAWDRARVY